MKLLSRFGWQAIFLIPALLVAAIYANSLEVPFLFDDYIAIKDNPAIRLHQFSFEEIRRILNSGRPVAYLSIGLNYYFHQFEVEGYHLVNIAIHLLAGFFLYNFIRLTLSLPLLADRYRFHNLVALGATLLWMVHPLHTNSVTYIIQRMASMASMFMIVSCLFYVKGRIVTGRKQQWLYFAASILSWLLALGCKQVAITLPFLILLYEWSFFQNFNRRWLVQRLQYVIAPFIVFVILAFYYLGANPWQAFLSGFDEWPFTPGQRFLTEFRVLIRYISLLLFPHPSRLNFDYDFPLSYSLIEPLSTIFSMAAVIILLGLAFHLSRLHPLMSFCIWWFFATLLLELIWPTSIIMEYKTYLPSMLFFVPVSAILFNSWRRPVAATVIICLAAVPLCLWTYERNTVWRDEITIWADVVGKSPQLARGYANLSQALQNNNRYIEAEEKIKKAIELNQVPNAKMHSILAQVYRKQKKIPESLAEARVALHIDQTLYEALITMGVCYEIMGRHRDAFASFAEAFSKGLDSVDLYNNWGMASFSLGMTDKAIELFNKGLAIDPQHRESHYNLGVAYSAKGMYEKARSEMIKGM